MNSGIKLDGSKGSLYRLNEEINESGIKFGKNVPSTLKMPLSWSVGDTGEFCQFRSILLEGGIAVILPPYSIGICSPVGGTAGESTGGSGGGP